MTHPQHILSILDQCCDAYSFPMLDNGYVYLAATRLSLFRSQNDWAMVIEVFGYSPRAGLPDTHIYTFASQLWNRDQPEDYVNRSAYEKYLTNNPHNESRFIHPIEEGDWQDPESCEWITGDAREIKLRGKSIPIPSIDEYARLGIELEDAPQVQVFELCRYLAESAREDVLATPEERRIGILPEMNQILQLEEWHHPDLLEDEKPSQLETFQQLAEVLATGRIEAYRPTKAPNTHWKNWPEGGRL